MKPGSKKALERWEKIRSQIRSATPVDTSETAVQKAARIKRLLDDPEAFYEYYFPMWCKSPSSKYHRRWDRALENPKYQELALQAFRGFSKSTRMAMYLIRKAMRKEVKMVMYASKSWDMAADLIEPIKIQFETNGRLAHDFGDQRNLGAWEAGYFRCRAGTTFKAVGRGQSPRGTRTNEGRPDMIVCDDLDDEELVESAERLDKAWEWTMGGLFGTFDISQPYKMVFLNNVLAEDCLMTRFARQADYVLQVNILDKNGQPTWPERYDKARIDRILFGTKDKPGKPAHIVQREYFNNPVKPGRVFKQEWMQWKSLPPLKSYQYLVAYLDPSFSDRKHADFKSWLLVGLWREEVHVIKAFCDRASVEDMISWGYQLDEYCKGRNGAAQLYMEEVFLQSLLYKEFSAAAKARGYHLPLRGDTRTKPQKDARIAAQAGKFERGVVFFNQAEASNRHMTNLVDQFLLFQYGNTRVKKDGPDAFEGAVYLLEKQVTDAQPMKWGTNKPHSKRF